VPIKPPNLSLIQDVNKWKKYVTEFKREKVLKFLTTGFLDFITITGSIASWGSPQRRGRRYMPKPPGASSMRIFDQSYRKVSGWTGTIPKKIIELYSPKTIFWDECSIASDSEHPLQKQHTILIR
jgi:hypothetical protein